MSVCVHACLSCVSCVSLCCPEVNWPSERCRYPPAPLHCHYMLSQYEGFLQSQQHNADECLSLHVHLEGVNAARQ